MSFQDLVKYLTQQFVRYVDTPKRERMDQKKAKKEKNRSWGEHWFGVIPTAISMLFKRH